MSDYCQRNKSQSITKICHQRLLSILMLSCCVYVASHIIYKNLLIQYMHVIMSLSFTPATSFCPVEIHTTQRSRAATASSFEMYYCSCESFSWNCKLCITSQRLRPKFPNPESQTSLKYLIYLPAFAQALSSLPHVECSIRVMGLLRGSWFPSKLACVSDSKIGLE